jgi:hypothetical protein
LDGCVGVETDKADWDKVYVAVAVEGKDFRVAKRSSEVGKESVEHYRDQYEH